MFILCMTIVFLILGYFLGRSLGTRIPDRRTRLKVAGAAIGSWLVLRVSIIVWSIAVLSPLGILMSGLASTLMGVFCGMYG